ncbi:tandem C2 domains nuclear protein isoform X2 [Narcine bancroftii]|uniref:tandem C2 domains nuclear protein isoform X2 n=1 Tax=Narcine bancroftii TaxID=1343680 RepID=UPI003831DB73
MAALELDTSVTASPWLLVPAFIVLMFSVVLGIAAEFLKDCCRDAIPSKKDVAEVPCDPANPPSKPETNLGSKKLGFTEDILLSKLPPNGKEIPFVVPNLKTAYIQPNFYGSYEEAMSGFSRAQYTERKLELSNALQHVPDIDDVYNPNYMISPISPGSGKHVLTKGKMGSPHGSAADLRSPKLSNSPGLSSSMFDLSSIHQSQRLSSTSSINSTASSLRDSLGSTRSLDGHPDECGKLNLKLSYRPEVEQIWITVVQVKDFYLRYKPTEKVHLYLKGILTLPKPVQFKSSIKDGNMTCHALLRVGTCFQAISNRIQLQVLEIQNLPSSSTPLALTFYVKIIMETRDGLFDKKKTRPLKSVNGQVKWGESFLFPVVQNELHLQRVSFTLKVYSKTSVRRKHHLGQVVIGWDSTGVALEQWHDTSDNPEKVVINWHHLSLT